MYYLFNYLMSWFTTLCWLQGSEAIKLIDITLEPSVKPV